MPLPPPLSGRHLRALLVEPRVLDFNQQEPRFCRRLPERNGPRAHRL